MPNLILKVQGNKYVNHSFFRPFLYVYDDKVVYTKRHHVVKVDEITMAFEHIARINIHRGLLFSRIEIMTSGGEGHVTIKGVWNKTAKKAKKLIEQKVFSSHNKPQTTHATNVQGDIHNFEKSLTRLRELLHRGKITQKEFDKKRNDLVKELS